MTECIEWPFTRGSHGYGMVRDRSTGRRSGAHRMVWEEAHGPIPGGMCICHHSDNMRDMIRKGRRTSQYKNKTHCPSGHEYWGENIELTARGRRCKPCHRANSKALMRRYRLAKHFAKATNMNPGSNPGSPPKIDGAVA